MVLAASSTQGPHMCNRMVRIGYMLETLKDWDTCPVKT